MAILYLKKKILVNIFMGLLSIVSIFCIAFSYTYSNSKAAITTVGITMGRGPNCSVKSGLCSISEQQNNRRTNNDYDLIGQLTTNQAGQLVLRIAKSTLTVKEMEQLFKNGYLELSKSFEVPSVLLQDINIQDAKNLKKGFYTVEANADYFIIPLEQ